MPKAAFIQLKNQIKVKQKLKIISEKFLNFVDKKMDFGAKRKTISENIASRICC